MIRRVLGRTVVLSLLASALFVAPAAADDHPPEPVLTFRGGGWGHGIGMSQYGAYGRALAGHTHEQILGFYYAGTTLGTLPSSEPVRVRVGVTDAARIHGTELTVKIGDTPVASTTMAITARHVDGQWVVDEEVPEGQPPVDLCANKVCGGPLTIERTGGGPVTVDGVGRYGRGTIVLHPAGHGGAKECGGGAQFCVVNAGLTMDEYLFGLAEVPSSWPFESLKAQAVAGRSYAATRMRDRNWPEPFDLYATTADQAYTGWDKESTCSQYRWCEAVSATSGEVVLHGSTIATTFYSSSNGGHTAIPADVWTGGATLGYLQAKPDPFDDNAANPNATWEHTYAVADISRWFGAHGDLDVGAVERIVISGVPASGRVNFASVTVHGSDGTKEVSGKRLFDVLRTGCIGDSGCDPLLGTKFIIVSFADVSFDAWFYVPVQWMSGEGITTGVAPNTFGPAQPNTRAMIATFLWRFAGKPPPGGAHGFDDVVSKSFYEQAVAWLVERGITTGTSAATFSPDATITRAEAATFLWRFAGKPTPTAANPFTDVAPGRYFTDAVRWMAQHGLTTGTSTTTFSPNQALTRAEIATFLWRLAGTPEAFADHVALPDAMRDS